MFDWNHNGKRDTGDSFMDFMVFHQVMDAGKRTGRNSRRRSPSAAGLISWRSRTRWTTRMIDILWVANAPKTL